MRFIAKLLIALVGWYVFTYMGILPKPLQNPLYPYIERLDNFEVQTVSKGCYDKYINLRRNANLSVCATSGVEELAMGYTAYTDETDTYVVMNNKLFVCDSKELDYHEIYGDLDWNSTAVTVMEDHILLNGRGNRGQYVQVSSGKKMHTAYSRWHATARGGKLKDYGFMNEMRGLASEWDFSAIAQNLLGFLETQQDGKITTNQFCALLYYQSQGILVDYDGERAIFVNRFDLEKDTVYVADAHGLRLLTEIPKTTGHFCHADMLYYSTGNQVFKLDLVSGNSEVYYTAADGIRFLNYFITDGELVLALVTNTQVVYYTPQNTVTGTHPYAESFDRVVKGFYMSSYPYRAMLMMDDYPLGEDILMHKYIVGEEES